MKRIYLDDAGSAPVLDEVRVALQDLAHGNPSSPHSEGRAARALLDGARDMAASALGVQRTEITFVASGTEAVHCCESLRPSLKDRSSRPMWQLNRGKGPFSWRR